MFAFGFAGIFILTQMHGLSQPRWLGRWPWGSGSLTASTAIRLQLQN